MDKVTASLPLSLLPYLENLFACSMFLFSFYKYLNFARLPSEGYILTCFLSLQIFTLCAEEAAAQEQTGQVEECLKVNLLKIKAEMCKKVSGPAAAFMATQIKAAALVCQGKGGISESSALACLWEAPGVRIVVFISELHNLFGFADQQGRR